MHQTQLYNSALHSRHAYRRIRSTILGRFRSLGIVGPLTQERIHELAEEVLGASIQIRPLREITSDPDVCALFVGAAGTQPPYIAVDYASPRGVAHDLNHEYSHILCGHAALPSSSGIASLIPDLELVRGRLILGRRNLAVLHEVEAEIGADVLTALSHRVSLGSARREGLAQALQLEPHGHS